MKRFLIGFGTGLMSVIGIALIVSGAYCVATARAASPEAFFHPNVLRGLFLSTIGWIAAAEALELAQPGRVLGKLHANNALGTIVAVLALVFGLSGIIPASIGVWMAHDGKLKYPFCVAMVLLSAAYGAYVAFSRRHKYPEVSDVLFCILGWASGMATLMGFIYFTF